jgi:hypothetical protein
MTTEELNKAMKDCAQLHKIPASQRDDLLDSIITYEQSYMDDYDYDNLWEPDFNGAIFSELASQVYSLKEDPSREKIKEEITVLRHALENLSYAARDMIDAYVMTRQPEIPRDFHYMRLLALEACKRAQEEPVKKGRRRPTARIRFIKQLYSQFEGITGTKPSSSPSGCFCTLASYALESYGVSIESLSREVQKIKQFQADMEFLGIPDWDPDFCL